MKMIDRVLLEIRSARKARRNNPNPIKDWPQNVVSTAMGCDRGIPVDRWYIEKFIKANQRYIRGDVIEIGDNSYTVEYGKDVRNSYIFTADITKKSSNTKIIFGDLQNGQGCQHGIADCFILTQTLPFIFDIKNAAKHIVNMLKPDGVALITVSGISMISEYDNSRWGHYWGFTETSLCKLFEGIIEEECIEVVSMRNPKAAAACLYGLSVGDLSRADLEAKDILVPVIIGMTIKNRGK